MEYYQILDRALALIGGGSPGLFTTVGEGGYPHSRWMMPSAIPRLKGMIYAVTARGFAKVVEIQADPRVEWVFQASDFAEVTTLRGRARIVDDPSFSAEVLKAIGPHLPPVVRAKEKVIDFRISQLAFIDDQTRL